VKTIEAAVPTLSLPRIRSVIDDSYDVSEYRRQLVPEMDEAAMPQRR
jgi:hypothetical protein